MEKTNSAFDTPHSTLKVVGCAGNAPAGRKARRIYSPSRLFIGLTAPFEWRMQSAFLEVQHSAPCILNSSLKRVPCWNCTNLCGFADRRLRCSANGTCEWSGSRDLHPDRLLHRERCY